jgi:hypothetical protein
MLARSIVALGLVAAPAALAAAPPLGDTAVAALSQTAPGAKQVVLTIRFRTELQCGRLSSPSLTVRLPAAMHVPARIRRADVTVSGKPPATVAVSRRTSVALTFPKPGITCYVLGPGTVMVRFAAHAGLGNPARAGTYDFSVGTPRHSWRGVLTIG